MTTNHDPLTAVIGTLPPDVLVELGMCPFYENVNDASMCLCGLPALTHDEAVVGIFLNDHPLTAAWLDSRAALVRAWLTTDPNSPLAAVRSLADEWGTRPESSSADLWEALNAALTDIDETAALTATHPTKETADE